MSCKLEEAIKDIEALASKPGAKLIAKELLQIAKEAKESLKIQPAAEYQRKGEYSDNNIKAENTPSITLKEGSNSLLVPTRAPNGLKSKAVKALKGFDIKDEFHLTVFGFPQGKEITEWLKVNGARRMVKLQKLIDEADFSYVESPEIDRISRDREEFIDWNNKELGKHTIHEEAIIQLVKAPGVKKFIDKVNDEFGFNFPVPFPHISLAVKGTKFGIGIADAAAYKALKPVAINDAERTAAELITRIASLKEELKSATEASEIKMLNEMLEEAEADAVVQEENDTMSVEDIKELAMEVAKECK